MNAVRIGIVGYGNVGRATAAIIEENSVEFAQRTGCPLKVTYIARRSPVLPQDLPAGVRYVNDWRQVVESDEVDIVVESMGGTETAREVVLKALELRKPVVTANKNLLAKYGNEIQALATRKRVPFGMEAAVAGGIPVVRAITDGMTGDRLKAVYGILNGTTNYILTQMENLGLGFEEALAQAQQKGYAEADPAADIDGIDARDKLCILARLAFHGWVSESKIATRGIRNITASDFYYARQLESTIRLVGHAELNEQGVEVSVSPWLVSRKSMLANVEGVNNAVFLIGERIGKQMFYGPGAGPDATGTAVVADIVEIARGIHNKAPQQRDLAGFDSVKPLTITERLRPLPWYLRLTVRDHPGILARVAQIMAEAEINIDAVLQMPNMPKESLSFVITVEPVLKERMNKAVERINKLDFMLTPVLLLRMESGT